MLSPLPTLSNAGPLPLPEAAAPLRDSGSGPDFSQLMQQQADRQAALRAVDQQVATQARHADADRAPAAAAPRAAADQPGRPADPEAGAARREPAPAAAPRSDAARADGEAPTRDGPTDAQRAAARRLEAPGLPRPATAAGAAGQATARAETGAAADTAPPDTAASARDTIHSVRLFPHEQAYAVRTYNAARDLDDQGRQWTYVHMIDGTIIGTRHDNGSSGGDQFFAWQYPLHSGKAFGEVGRWLVFLGGLATVHLCIGGWMLWARRRPRKLRRA